MTEVCYRKNVRGGRGKGKHYESFRSIAWLVGLEIFRLDLGAFQESVFSSASASIGYRKTKKGNNQFIKKDSFFTIRDTNF